MTATSFYFRSLPCDQVGLIIHLAVTGAPCLRTGFLCSSVPTLQPQFERTKVTHKYKQMHSFIGRALTLNISHVL